MAATVDDILTVADMKVQLRLPAGHVSEDDLIGSLISQAVDQVALDTGVPLLDAPVTAYADQPASDQDPLVICEQDFTFDTSNTEHDIDYFTDSKTVGDGPTGSISRDEIGRVATSGDGRSTFLYLKVGNSWPTDILPGTRIRVVGTRNSPVADGLKSAVIILARFLYAGDQNWPANPAYVKLVAPYRRLTPNV